MKRRNTRTLVGARVAATLLLSTTIGGAAAAAAPRVVSLRRSPTIGTGVLIVRTTPTTPAPLMTREVGAQALELITIDWRSLLPGWRVEFKEARDEYLAMTWRTERRIEIYVRSNRTPEALAHDIAHELGHAIDVTYNDETIRARYLDLRGLPPSTPWWACGGCTDFEVAAGDFAETFAAWAAPRFRFYSTLAPEPSPQSLAAIALAVFPQTRR